MPILKTRIPFKQVAGDGTMYDANGNEILLAEATNTAVNHLRIKNAATNTPPTLEALGDDTNVSLNLMFKGDAAVSIGDDADAAPGKIELTSSDKANGLSFTFDDSGHSAYTLTFPANVPSGAAFMKVDTTGNVTFSTGSASSFDIVADTGSTQTINSGDAIEFAGTAEQIDTEVGATDKITLSLSDVVNIVTALKVPAIQSAAGSAALTISSAGDLTTGGDLTVAGDLTVQGTTTTVDSTTLTVADATITIAEGATTTTAANDAGIYVAGSADGSNAYASFKWEKEDVWKASTTIDVNDSANGELQIGGRKIADYNGVYFYGDDAVGAGLKVNADNKVMLDMKTEQTDISAGSNTTQGGQNVTRITPANALVLDHVQVFLNGILQKTTDPTTNTTAYGDLGSGDFDCVVRAGTGGIDFLQSVVESSDLVTLFYVI